MSGYTFANWRIALLAMTSVVLSIASGWTTWDGMSNFTSAPALSFLITFGIQSVLLISAWMLGEALVNRFRSTTSDRMFSSLLVVLAALLGLGIGVINCYLSAVFPVWDQAWSILNRPMFLLSTIFFVFEDVPWQFQGVLWYNPLIHIIGLMRRGFYPTYDAAYVSVSYVLAVSLIPLALGLVVLNRYSREILNR